MNNMLTELRGRLITTRLPLFATLIIKIELSLNFQINVIENAVLTKIPTLLYNFREPCPGYP